MPFEPGNQYGKRNRGVKKTKNQQWETFALWFMSKGMERLETELATLEGKDYVVIVKDMLEYFKPKLARTENKHEGEVGIKITTKDYAKAANIPSPPISIEADGSNG